MSDLEAVRSFCRHAANAVSTSAMVHNVASGRVTDDALRRMIKNGRHPEQAAAEPSDAALWDLVHALPKEPCPPTLPWPTERAPVQRDDKGVILSPMVVVMASGDNDRDVAAASTIGFAYMGAMARDVPRHFAYAVSRGADSGRIYVVTGRRGHAPRMITWGEQWDAARVAECWWDGKVWEPVTSLVSELEPWCPEAIAWAMGEIQLLLETCG